MFVQQFTKQLASVSSAPLEEARQRAETDPAEPLPSGRTPEQVLDRFGELVALLKDVWSRDQLATVPGSVRVELLAGMKRARARIAEYAERQTTPQELEAEVDRLHVLMLQAHLTRPEPDEAALAYKNKQLDRLRDKGRRVNRELRKGLAIRDQVGKSAGEADEVQKRLKELLEDASAALETIESNKALAETASTAASQSADEAKRLEAAVTESESRSKQTENEVGALRERIKVFLTRSRATRRSWASWHPTQASGWRS